MKRSVINVKNKDLRCFAWSVLAYLRLTDNANQNRVSNYLPYEGELDFDGKEFLVQLTDFARFEKLNEIAVNVYGYEKELHPLRIYE